MATSTYPVVRARLVEIFRTAVLDLERGDKIDVTYGWPAGRQIERDAVIVGRIRDDRTNTEWAALAGLHKKRDEKYGITLYVVALDPGQSSQQVATERAFDIFAACDQAVIDDLTLGLDPQADLGGAQIIVAAASQAAQDTDMPGAEGFGTQVEWSVHIHSRI